MVNKIVHILYISSRIISQHIHTLTTAEIGYIKVQLGDKITQLIRCQSVQVNTPARWEDKSERTSTIKQNADYNVLSTLL